MMLASIAATDARAGDKLPPVAVELCTGEEQSATNPNLKVGIGFRNLGDIDAVHVAFDVLLLDANGKLVDTRVVAMDGKFGPNIFIQPQRSPTTDVLLTQPEYPDSPAWNVADHYGSGVTTVRCQVDSVRFADGTAWDHRTPQPQASLPALPSGLPPGLPQPAASPPHTSIP